MRFVKEGRLSAKIIRTEDILDMAHFFEGLIQEQKRDTCTFVVHYTDGTNVTTNDSSVFESEAFRRKSAKVIRMSFESEGYKNAVSISLTEEAFFDDISNEYQISSSDEVWLNATTAKLKELIGDIPNRNWFRHTLRFPWIIFTYFPFQLACIGIGYLCGGRIANREEFTGDGVFLPIKAYILICILLYVAICALICWLYPIVEFDLQTQKSNQRKKMRKIVGFICSALVVPILLGFVV